MILGLMIAGAVAFYAYVIGIIIAGAYDSLSQGFYVLLRKVYKNVDAEDVARVFSAWCFLVPILVCYPLHELTADTWGQFFVLPLCCGYAGVGLTPDYGNSKYTYWHYGFAALIGLSALAIAWSFGVWYGVAMLGALAVSLTISYFTPKHDWIMCVEVGGATALFAEMFIKHLM